MTQRDTINSCRDQEVSLEATGPITSLPPKPISVVASPAKGWPAKQLSLMVRIDGTAMQLLATEELLKEFGYVRAETRPRRIRWQTSKD